jgi:hypothetical protein
MKESDHCAWAKRKKADAKENTSDAIWGDSISSKHTHTPDERPAIIHTIDEMSEWTGKRGQRGWAEQHAENSGRKRETMIRL